MTRRSLLVLALLAAVPALARDAKRPLAVAAAANLKAAAEELRRAFEADNPGVAVGLTFGASGTFFAQIQNGAPFDVFLSADREYPAKVDRGPPRRGDRRADLRARKARGLAPAGLDGGSRAAGTRRARGSRP